MTGLAFSPRRLEARNVLTVGSLVCLMAVEGVALTHSYLWAAPLVCLLLLLVAVDIPLVPFLAVVLAVRVLTDASASSPDIRHTAALNLSAAIALLFIVVAAGLLLHRRRGGRMAFLALCWLGLWTVLAAHSQGLSTVTLREGVREASIVALFLIVYNSKGVLNLSLIARIVGLIGAASATVALFQFATHSGILLEGHIRANGTISHPDGAAVLFAISAVSLLWRYLDDGRRRSDAVLAAICAAGTIVTFSLTGLGTLLVMLLAYATLRPGAPLLRRRTYAVAALVLVAFLATPIGGQRIASQATTQLNTTQRRGAENTSLAWRLHKWGVVIEEWEQKPLFGQGLGATVTAVGTVNDPAAGKAPHNEYIRYLVETGIVGLLALLVGAAVLVRRLWDRRQASLSEEARGQGTAAALGLAVVLGCLFNALAANTLLFTVTGYVVAMLLAACLAAPAATSSATRAGAAG
jgi:O-antigen ligase